MGFSFQADNALANTVNSAAIQDGTIVAADIATDGVGTDEIAAGAVGTSELATSAVTEAKIANDAVVGVGTDAAKPAASAVRPGYLYLSTDVSGGTLYRSNGTTWVQAASSVAAAGVADGSISTAKLADDAVTAAKLADDATTDANRAVTTNHIRDDAVTAAKLADDATTDANRAVTTNHIRDAAVTAAKIATDTITASQIAADAIGSSELANNAVDSAAIAANAVTAGKLADGAVDTTARLADGIVTNAKMAANFVGGVGTDASKPAASAVPAGTLYLSTDVSGGTLYRSNGTTWVQAASSVSAAGVADGSISNAKLDTTLLNALGLATTGEKRRGSKSIATSETVTSTIFTTLTTPDRVTDIILPTAGVLRIGYKALIKLTAQLYAAIFIDGVQLKVAQNNGVPIVATHFNNTSTFFTPLFTSPGADPLPTSNTSGQGGGMISGSSTTSDSSDVGTGQALGRASIGPGGFLEVFADAGTYTVEVQFKVDTGTGTIKERKLWVEAIGFPAE